MEHIDHARMDAVVAAFKEEINKITTGRIHPSLLERVRVDGGYGDTVELKVIAKISPTGPRTLKVTVWESDSQGEVEKAIEKADLGLNVASEGQDIIVRLPEMTQEVRAAYAAKITGAAKKSREAVQAAGREAADDLDARLSAKTMSEDDARRARERVQKATEARIGEIDAAESDKLARLQSS
ncbi:ribosome-recycling factor [Streptomyces sp. NPDC087440]|uniref:ribosome-recycling factor n=1 Tax=Streptomyces sp. NPDC087440 TaxID=3365790 RepID=UPI0037FBED07